ncbi:sugar phosphate isomerase/epimerase [Opitutaceae bacterium]|nr:sugar phosphate isomerase/epimerase [Opitutaceae bacterium]
MKRREFVSGLGVAGAAMMSGNLGRANAAADAAKPFTLSLSQWAFHRAIFWDARDNYGEFIETLHRAPDDVLKGKMDPRDIVWRAQELGVGVVDLVNILWLGHGQDQPWLADFKSRARDAGVTFGVLMCDQLGRIAAKDSAERQESIAGHTRWMETAAELGCPFLRVNPYGEGSYLEQLKRGAETLHVLAERSADYGLEILVENHGHPGSNGAWLAMWMEQADHPRLGTYTDLDNFFMGGWNHDPERRYDRTQGLLDLAPYTKAISAKTHDFGPDGEETTIDYHACLKILLDAGFSGLVGAEYEGHRLSEPEGSRMTIELLRREQKRFA